METKRCKHCNDDLATVTHDTNATQCSRCRNYKHRYGVHGGTVDKMFESQGGKCYLCDKEMERYSGRKKNAMHLDHNHETGEIRSLLCMKCNTMVGVIEANKVDIERIKKYLE
jgi:hypothetical protein